MAEKGKARGGCRKVALWGGIGCLAIPIGLVLFAAITLLIGWARYGDEGPPQPEHSALTVPAGERSRPGEVQQPGEDEGIVPGRDIEQLQTAALRPRPVKLTLDLTEAIFTIAPGPPGTDIQVEGFFDPGTYELTQEEEEGDGRREITIRFRRTVPFLFHLLRGGFTHRGRENENKVNVRIPEDLPTSLDLDISKGESRIDVGGLDLTSLEADLKMGEHHLRVSRPLRNELEQVSFRTGMGEVTLEQLGNARAREISINGRMGELSVDLSGEWPRGFTARANVSFSMGECRVGVPREVRISPNSRSSIFLGESRDDALERDQPSDPDAPVLEIHASAKMGELRIERR